MGLGSTLWRLPSRFATIPTRALEGITEGLGNLAAPKGAVGKFNKYGEIGVDAKATTHAADNPNDLWWYGVKKDKSGADVAELGGFSNRMLEWANSLKGLNHAIRGKSSSPSMSRTGSIWSSVKSGLKDAGAGLVMAPALDMTADSIAPASGYYLNMPYTDPSTGEQKTIKVHADYNTINPQDYYYEDPETKKIVKSTAMVRGQLEKANPIATFASNVLRTVNAPAKYFSGNLGKTLVAPFFPSGQGAYDTNNNVVSLMTPSAETAKLYAENARSKMHELYSTKTPSQIRALMQDKAALANYLTDGVKLPTRARGVFGAASRLADRQTADIVKQTILESLEKNLPDNIGMYLSAANVAGDLPGIGNSVNDMVHRAMDNAIGNIDEKIYGAYMNKLSPYSRFIGLTGYDLDNFANTGINNGRKLIEARYNKINKTTQTGQNQTTNI